MRTTRPISTVWFGSAEFLKFKLDDAVRRGELDYYCFIKHLPEDDEKKEHCHLYCVPSHRIDTQSLTSYLTEYDPNNAKPIVPLPWRNSKFSDWWLYGLHDSGYLASIGQTRKYKYSMADVETSSEEFLNEMIHTIDMSKIKTIERVKALLDDGKSFEQIVAMGVVPIQLIRQYQLFAEMYVNQIINNYEVKTSRNGKRGHEDESITPDDVPF